MLDKTLSGGKFQSKILGLHTIVIALISDGCILFISFTRWILPPGHCHKRTNTESILVLSLKCKCKFWNIWYIWFHITFVIYCWKNCGLTINKNSMHTIFTNRNILVWKFVKIHTFMDQINWNIDLAVLLAAKSKEATTMQA